MGKCKTCVKWVSVWVGVLWTCLGWVIFWLGVMYVGVSKGYQTTSTDHKNYVNACAMLESRKRRHSMF
jgi:hypothetical protein